MKTYFVADTVTELEASVKRYSKVKDIKMCFVSTNRLEKLFCMAKICVFNTIPGDLTVVLAIHLSTLCFVLHYYRNVPKLFKHR